MGLATSGFFLTLSPGVARCQRVPFRHVPADSCPVQRIDAILTPTVIQNCRMTEEARRNAEASNPGVRGPAERGVP